MTWSCMTSSWKKPDRGCPNCRSLKMSSWNKSWNESMISESRELPTGRDRVGQGKAGQVSQGGRAGQVGQGKAGQVSQGKARQRIDQMIQIDQTNALSAEIGRSARAREVSP